MTRDEIIAEARAWLGTPYRHQESLIGVGTDCLGLLRGVWRGCVGDEPEAVPPYSPDWAERSGEDPLLDVARTHLSEIAPGEARPGDVLLFRMAIGCPAKHCAILSQHDRIVHAYWGQAVVETRLVPWWRRRIATAFSFPGLET